jgi:hypothetical protein
MRREVCHISLIMGGIDLGENHERDQKRINHELKGFKDQKSN